MAQPPFDLNQAHRWFAVECNNAAWDLIENTSRTDEQVIRMLQLAYASAYHWSCVGMQVNHLRAEHLLTAAHGAAGNVQAMSLHSKRAQALSRWLGETQSSWDRTMTHLLAARTAGLLGDPSEAEAQRAAAAQCAAKLEPEERKIYDTMIRNPSAGS